MSNHSDSKKRFVTLDGGLAMTCSSRDVSSSTLSQTAEFPAPAIPRGAGMSYCAATFGEGITSLDHVNSNTIRGLDTEKCLVEVDAGVTQAQLYDYLLPHKLFIPTQPGYPTITIGGCIAPDGHGKNQARDGTFKEQVESLKLFHPSHGVIELSRTKEPQLFDLTCGGFGLTGNIISAVLRVKKMPSAWLYFHRDPLPTIDDLAYHLKKATTNEFVITWHDFTLSRARFGAGFVMHGSFVPESEAPEMSQDALEKLKVGGRKFILTSESRGSLIVPVFNQVTTSALNWLYSTMSMFGGGGAKKLDLFSCMFPSMRSRELYYMFFGKAGLHEYQAVIPEEKFSYFCQVVKERIIASDTAIALASAKWFQGEQNLLRFTGTGINFALNFPRCKNSLEFFEFLDDLTLEIGALPNIIKDSRLSARMVKATYPEYELFRERLHAFDPKRLYRSELSDRLEI